MRPAPRSPERSSSGRCSRASRTPAGRAWRWARRCLRSGATARRPRWRRELADDDPLAVIARRTELFARIAGGDDDGAREALDRARAAGMAHVRARPVRDLARARAYRGSSDRRRHLPSCPRHHLRNCLRHRLPSTRSPPLTVRRISAPSRQRVEPLSEQAVALLEVMLEALLRVHDFESFEVLLGALERTPLQPRERRELLAGMYLRRGFVASAAQEWMAVCEQEPDVPALLGLARVAAAQRHGTRDERLRGRRALARPRQRGCGKPPLSSACRDRVDAPGPASAVLAASGCLRQATHTARTAGTPEQSGQVGRPAIKFSRKTPIT